MKMKVKQLDSKQEWKQVVNLRQEVFVDEQGVPRELELDGKDEAATHFVAIIDEQAVGTCRLRINNQRGKVERMAVKAGFRKQGIGSKLLTYVIQFAQQKKLTELSLHAQKQVVGFYQQHGFQITSSEIIQEAGIDHLKMKRKL